MSGSLSGYATPTGFPVPTLQECRSLFRQSLAAFVVLIAGTVALSPLAFGLPTALGIVVSVLAIAPTLVWARKMPYNYPFFEIFLGANLTSYGIPLISDRGSAAMFGEDVRCSAAGAVIVFELAAMATFYALRFRPGRSAFWARSFLERPSPVWLGCALAATTVYAVVTTFYWYPDSDIVGILRALTLGIATAVTFILSIMWGRGELQPGDKAFLVANLLLQFVVFGLSLVLRQGATLVLIGLAGYFFGRRRIPWLAGAACLALFAILNFGKYTMRGEYWFSGNRPNPEFSDMGEFYADWIGAGLHGNKGKASGEANLLERSSLLQILCLVVSESPAPRPFLGGETYLQTLGQFVPRWVWPDKPRGHISTNTLSIYYGLQDDNATYSTTIAFGFLPEAYANYGYAGAVALAVIFSAGFRLMACWSKNSPLLSCGGVAVVMLTAWSFQTELTFSIWITSLGQALTATVGVVWVTRRLFGVDG